MGGLLRGALRSRLREDPFLETPAVVRTEERAGTPGGVVLLFSSAPLVRGEREREPFLVVCAEAAPDTTRLWGRRVNARIQPQFYSCGLEHGGLGKSFCGERSKVGAGMGNLGGSNMACAVVLLGNPVLANRRSVAVLFVGEAL